MAFFSLEIPLWEDTDSILDSVRALIKNKDLPTPIIAKNDDDDDDDNNNDNNDEDNDDNDDDDNDNDDNDNDDDNDDDDDEIAETNDNENTDDTIDDDYNPETEIDQELQKYYMKVFRYVIDEVSNT